MHTTDVIISTYNWPEALDKTLIGMSLQTDSNFNIIIADDGSGSNTRRLIQGFKQKYGVPITHCWQEDKGFRRAMILNKAVKTSKAQQLIFTDQDSIPHPQLVECHRRQYAENTIIAGGYMKLSKIYSENITTETVKNKEYLQ
jgi:cellulose synthase/poly-beta-1,6-N-acetylglucosamine synthase-like glycosyltransferase